MGYVWCDGYVWDMCGVRYVWDMCGVRYVWDMCGVRYVWDMCGVRYANNLLKNPATKRLSGKTKRVCALNQAFQIFKDFFFLLGGEVYSLFQGHYVSFTVELLPANC